jgi:hypothetical protein
MTGELVLLGMAALVAAGLLTPVGRRLLRTTVDLIDGSLLAYGLRQTLGLDTTTRRARRIAQRRAAEQAEIERRIGVGAMGSAMPAALPPTRLVASGEASGGGRFRLTAFGGTTVTRQQHLRDAATALAVIVIAVVGLNLFDSRTDGGVLSATGTPGPAATEPSPTTSASATASPTTTASNGSLSAVPAGAPAAEATAGPAATAVPGTPSPVAGDVPLNPITFERIRFRMTGTRAGSTVQVRLAWAAHDAADRRGAAAGIDGFRLEARIDGGRWRLVERLPARTTSVVQAIDVGRSTTFRLRATGEAIASEDAGPAVATWPAMRPVLLQDGGGRIDYSGAWGSAEGSSLSGGTVRFATGAGGRAAIRFRGTDVGWLATLTPTSGRARVVLDGRVVATVDLRSSAVAYRQLVFRRHLPSAGPHVLEIRPLGDGRVDLDAIVALR